MKKLVGLTLATLLSAGMAFAADQTSGKVLDRVQQASSVLEEIMAAPDKGIPEEILSSADCVAIVPSMKNGGFVVGGRYGRGIATCRNGQSWSAPAPFVVEGGSWGLQIGGQAIDLVMLVMNKNGMEQLLNSKFKVGADASAAAGPVGRHAEGSTDWKMRSEILTYSRARGAFAGITLNGAVVKQDDDSTQELYGRVIPFKQLLQGNVPTPPGARTFITDVAKYFHSARSGDAVNASRTTDASGTTTATTGGTTGTATTSSDTRMSNTTTTGSVSSNTAPSTTSTSPAPATSTAPASTTSGSADMNSSAAPANSTDTTPGTSSTAPSGATGTPTSATAGMSNADIQKAIQRSIRNDSSLANSSVNVVVTQDAIEVAGNVASNADKDTVRHIVEQYAGSRKIVDRDLTVK